jgi:hypothetical protein
MLGPALAVGQDTAQLFETVANDALLAVFKLREEIIDPVILHLVFVEQGDELAFLWGGGKWAKGELETGNTR